MQKSTDVVLTKDLFDWVVLAKRLVRFAVSPNPSNSSSAERFAAQLALARVHPNLIALERTPGGYAMPRDETRGWFELRAKRGLAGYGLARALRMLLDVLTGLSALEDTRTEKGVPFVHGEVVPAMLRVDPRGATRLVALAPWHWGAPGTLPVPERHGHLAPERLLGDVIDARADVFSAGVLLWEALAGRRLFETDSVDGIVMRLMGGKITLPELPPELSWAVPLKAIASCALSVDPEQRFANCLELADAIGAVAGGHVATHGDVADFLRAPEPVARSSVFDEPPTLPTHHSSLSALIAPLQATERPLPSTSERAPREQSPEPRISRSVWAIAALSCAVGAIGASAIARYAAPHGERQSASASAPVLGAALPTVAPSPGAAPEPSAPLEVAPSVAKPIELPPPAAEIREKEPKPHKAASQPKATTPKLRAPLKASRSVEKTAVKYGI